MENTAYTFTTPVFNGSASLRDAAGQLIEEVTKSVRRKQTVDESYFVKLFSDIRSLYRLDQIRVGGSSKADLGPLPTASKVLIGSLIAVWLGIGSFWLWGVLRKKKRSGSRT